MAQRCLSRDKSKVKKFTQFLLNRVKILRVVVPEDTDLNHYFEIMNNRGEQLEKHEVLKARLMNKLGANNSKRNAFAKIWDACANMSRYVQLGFDASARGEIFGKDWDQIPDDFGKLCKTLSTSNETIKKQTLADIIATPVFKSGKSKTDVEEAGTFGSIIR